MPRWCGTRVPSEVCDQLAVRFEVLFPHLDERQRRLVLATEARLLGHGGVRAVARVAEVSETTVRKGVFELEGGETTKSLRHLAEDLARQGHPVSAPTVGRLLRENGFSLQVNAKTLEGRQHPDRDSQFRYINEQVKDHQASGEPVISVDAKKKEKLGQLPSAGREWCPKGGASTRTRTGLRVEAELDTGAYPLGMCVSTDRMKMLPVEPHPCRGAWNYTIRPPSRPAALAAPGTGKPTAAPERAAALELLSAPCLTGMSRAELDAMAQQLATAQAAQREELRYQERGGKRRQVPGAHGRPLLSARDRLLINVLHLRQVCAQKVLAEIVQVTPPAIGQAIRETLPLLDEHHYAFTPTALHFTQAQEVLAFVQTGSATPPRHLDISTVLSDPSLPGMSREDLQKLTDRLLVRYTALRERHRYQRRGGPRQPGTNGGAFHQKVAHAERVLAAVLHQREVCTRQVLADLFDVTPQTIGTIFRDLSPLLEEDGHHPTPATPFRTAADLLASVAPPENAPEKNESPC
ncbi:ISAzo13 family transposase [Streptomyces sp. NPDC002785]|uniref:ISAzo13-like element transposase-related protein n=1 Tax=Streptomyces sp. NPDC002785 TaxID=3154543 RepID=UPI003326B080